MTLGLFGFVINEKTELEDIRIYPNPAKGLVHIEMPEPVNTTIKVYNINGQLIHLISDNHRRKYSFELNHGPGMYYIEIIFEGQTRRYKLLGD